MTTQERIKEIINKLIESSKDLDAVPQFSHENHKYDALGKTNYNLRIDLKHEDKQN